MPATRTRLLVVPGAAQGISRSISRMLAERGVTIVAVDLGEPTVTLEMLDQPVTSDRLPCRHV